MKWALCAREIWEISGVRGAESTRLFGIRRRRRRAREKQRAHQSLVIGQCSPVRLRRGDKDAFMSVASMGR